MNTETIINQFEYLNKESLDENFKCRICVNPLFNPVSTNCNPQSHMFCRNCIEKWIKSDPSCPTCSQKLHIQDLTHITIANIINFLNNQLVKCLACEQTDLKRIDFDAHYNEICPEVEVQCPSSDSNCSWQGTRSQLEEHLKICIINLIKPLLTAFQTSSQQWEDRIIEIQTEIEQLRNDKVNRPRLSAVRPIKPFQQRQVAEPVKLNTQINKEIIFPQVSSILDKLDQNRIQTEAIIKENKQLSTELNQAAIQNTVFKDMNREKESQLKQLLTIEPTKIQESLTDGYTNQKYGKNPGGRTENYAYSAVPKTAPNLSVDTSGYDQPFPQNYFNAKPYTNVNNNASGNIAQNTLNHPVQENTGTYSGRTKNNVAGGTSTSICAGNINIGEGCHNNVAGGNSNRIAGGNNYGGEGSNNNDIDGRNNNLVNGNDNLGGAINNAGGGVNNGVINNDGGTLNGTGSNNRAGNNIAGNGNNIAGGRDNSIVNGIINTGGNSNTIAGGCKNYIASGNNIVYNNNNNNNNPYKHNDTPNDDMSEDGTNSSVDHPNDERRSEISSIDGRFRANLDGPHPPFRNNHWDS